MQAAGKTPSQSEIIKTVKEWGDQLKEVGTPEDMPADVKSGYDVGLNTVESMADDATQQDLQKMDDALSADQKKDAQAFQAWVTKTCPTGEPRRARRPAAARRPRSPSGDRRPPSRACRPRG